MTGEKNHLYYMEYAIKLAQEAAAQGEVPVGAVIVQEGTIIGQGYNQCEQRQDPTAHAEILAIQAACRKLHRWRLSDCTLYVTLEPCPMCAGAIVAARMQRVVFGCDDSLWGGAGSIFHVLQHPACAHPVEVIGGIAALSCQTLLQDFFQQKRK